MSSFTPIASTVGGIMLGLASAALFAFNGRIAGISGVVGRLIRPERGEVAWRVLFLAGLLAGGVILQCVSPGAIGAATTDSPLILVVAGLCVGFGTRLANGCTSGHGVCGLSRRSPRSFTATMTFMATAIAVVFVLRHGVRT